MYVAAVIAGHLEHLTVPAFPAAAPPPVRRSQVARQYPYILVTEPHHPADFGVATRTLASNSSAALLAVDRGACREANSASGRVRRPPPQVTY